MVKESPILIGWLKKIIKVEVIFEMIDHCAKNATPKMVNTEDRNNSRSDWLTPQIIIRTTVSNIRSKTFTIFFVIFTLPNW